MDFLGDRNVVRGNGELQGVCGLAVTPVVIDLVVVAAGVGLDVLVGHLQVLKLSDNLVALSGHGRERRCFVSVFELVRWVEHKLIRLSSNRRLPGHLYRAIIHDFASPWFPGKQHASDYHQQNHHHHPQVEWHTQFIFSSFRKFWFGHVHVSVYNHKCCA